ncbi:hypothetical protein GGI43DRAFT_432698 [Trichoderma evansii]
MSTISIAIVGAPGKTGLSIVDGLLASINPYYDITALARHVSVNKPKYGKLKERGVKVVDVDLAVDAIADQIPLAKAAKRAMVKRFVPSAYATVVPPNGIVDVQDIKENVYHEIKRLHLPYTIIDVGWWYLGFIPHLPSGRTDYARHPSLGKDINDIPGEGNIKCCMIDFKDVGKMVAKIIFDSRILNKMVLACGDVLTINELYNIVDDISGEKTQRNYMSAKQILASTNRIQELITGGQTDYTTKLGLYWMQYFYSFGIRGDNTPENANYLGYINSKDLYPELSMISYRDFFKRVLDGNAKDL